jgi:hypothetical protein
MPAADRADRPFIGKTGPDFKWKIPVKMHGVWRKPLGISSL